MPLITCSNCGHTISTEAELCPGCGLPAVRALDARLRPSATTASKSTEVLSWSDWLSAFDAWRKHVGLMMVLLVALSSGPAAILKALGIEEFIPFFQLVPRS